MRRLCYMVYDAKDFRGYTYIDKILFYRYRTDNLIKLIKH